MDLESSYCYCFPGKAVLKPACGYISGISVLWRLLLSYCVLLALGSFSYQDSVPLVDQQLLYTCCPYLGEYFICICYIKEIYYCIFISIMFCSFGVIWWFEYWEFFLSCLTTSVLSCTWLNFDKKAVLQMLMLLWIVSREAGGRGYTVRIAHLESWHMDGQRHHLQGSIPRSYAYNFSPA